MKLNKKIWESFDIRVVILLFAIFLIRLPPFYFLPFGNLFMTHNLSSLLIGILFCSLVLSIFTGKRERVFIPFSIYIMAIFIVSQSLSVINVVNIKSYLSEYKDVSFAFFTFFVSFNLVNKKNVQLFIRVFIVTSFINLLFQLITYFYPQILTNYIHPILYNKYFEFLQYQTNRGRFFGDSFDEIMIPFITLYLFRTNKIALRLSYILLINAILFIVVVSNWRTKAVMALYSILSSFYIFRNELKKHLTILILLMSMFIIAANYFSHTVSGGNVLNRLLMSEIEDTQTIVSRFAFWKEAVSMGFSSPIAGVGLGNYFDNLTQSNKLRNMNSQTYKEFILIDDPHNIFMSIFAETGVIGLIAVFIMFMYFFISDIMIFNHKDKITQITIFSFWGLFIYSLLNPWLNLTYLIQIFFIRGVSEKIRI